MKTIDVMFDINDIVYELDYINLVKHLGKLVYTDCNVEKYIIRSISISCNSKGEWKKSYRGQRVCDGHITSVSFNFSSSDIGKTVFTSFEQAEAFAVTERIRLKGLVSSNE